MVLRKVIGTFCPMRQQGEKLRVSIEDITVSYNDLGSEDSPVILFIHGFPLNKSMWEGQLLAFQKTHRVIAYDVRGHGQTESGTGPFSIDLFVTDLLQLMDALKIEKATLCGLSMGGYIALNAIQSHPERFSALILCDTQCGADTPEGKEKRMKAIESLKKESIETYAEGSLPNLFAEESLKSRKEVVEAVRQMIITTREESLSKTLMTLAERKETCTRLKDINVPVLIVVGEQDTITPMDAAQLMHFKLLDSKLAAIPNAGHLSSLENLQAFNEVVREFLSSTDSIGQLSD